MFANMFSTAMENTFHFKFTKPKTTYDYYQLEAQELEEQGPHFELAVKWLNGVEVYSTYKLDKFVAFETTISSKMYGKYDHMVTFSSC